MIKYIHKVEAKFIKVSCVIAITTACLKKERSVFDGKERHLQILKNHFLHVDNHFFVTKDFIFAFCNST